MDFNYFFNKVACGLLVCTNDQTPTITLANDAFYNLVGYSKEEMKYLFNNKFTSLILDDPKDILERVGRPNKEKLTLDYEYRIRHSSGKTIWIHEISTCDPLEDKLYLAIMDITYKEKLLKRVSEAAEKDKMTGLLNRAALERNIEALIAANHSRDTQAMFLIDLDNFKKLNDLKGHQVGDKFLANVGNLLKKSFRKNDIIGRLGGDEFMIFFKNIKDIDSISIIANKLLHILNLKVYDVNISASIGICFDTTGSLSFEELYGISDKMLYKIKENMGNNYEISVIEEKK